MLSYDAFVNFAGKDDQKAFPAYVGKVIYMIYMYIVIIHVPFSLLLCLLSFSWMGD